MKDQARRDAESLRLRRDELLSEIAQAIRQRREAEEELLVAGHRRRLREEDGPDTSEAHLLGYVRDLARSLTDAQRDVLRRRSEARDAEARLLRTRARKAALESVLVRAAASARGESER